MRSRFLLAAPRLVLLACLNVPLGASAQGIFVTPVPNAPFSGVVKLEKSVVQPDGSIVNFKTIRNIALDGRGRIHNESRQLIPITSSNTPEVINIHLYDPQTRSYTMLDPKGRTFSTMTVTRPPATEPSAVAALAGRSLPQNDFTKKDDLGIHEMGELAVHGVRQTQTILPNGDTPALFEIPETPTAERVFAPKDLRGWWVGSENCESHRIGMGC